MMKHSRSVFAALVLAAVFVSGAAQAAALDIFPINKAQILAGARFDLKIELDAVVDPAKVTIKVNGADYQKALGTKLEFVEKDGGLEASAFIARNVSIKTAGVYMITVNDGTNFKSATWEVYAPAAKAKAKNVIFLIADGLSVGHRTAARIMSKGVHQGSANGLLAMDMMDATGLLGTSSVDSLAVDSANSMSAYMTGHKSSVNALGVYADRTKDPFDDPKQETLGELVRRSTKKSIGIVSDTELQDATPAAVVGHTRKRDEKAALVQAFLDLKPEVILGGGSAYFLPKSVTGSKRVDETDFIDLFKKAGYALATSGKELAETMATKPARLLGLFNPGNLDGVLDRLFLKKGTGSKFPDQPDLTTMTKAALSVLSTNKEGFLLVVEAGLVDKYTHPMDWERAVYDTIMFDKVIAIAQEFAAKNPDTLIVVTGDHTHSISVYGTVDDNKAGESIRDKVGTYGNAGYTNYTDANSDGYPDSPAVSKRLAVGFGNHPDYYETFKPKLDGPFSPTIKNEKGQYVANEQYKDGAVLIQGNLSYADSTEVHSIDDMVLTMSGPGSDQLKAYQENTSIFRYLVTALGLKP